MLHNKFWKNLGIWVLYIAVLICLIYAVPKALAYILKTEYPMAAITSSSMWPSLKKGDLVLIKGIQDKKEIKIGDIIVYENPRGFTIHRVIKTGENTLITKGDANNSSDSAIRYEDVIGRTLTFNEKTMKIPLLGNLSIIFNKKSI